ncbi:MAG: hypothetical protein MJZ28_07005 [Paludibacteraceae bacterium]|nr:hypothetical protein [Paludibacteraceae bacterium]
MKKVFFAIATLLSMALGASAQNPGEDNGFGLKLQVGIPGNNYGCPENHSETGYSLKHEYSGAMFGLGLENRWYVWHNDKMGVAVHARWMDILLGGGEVTTKTSIIGKKVSSETVDVMNVELGLLGVGPMYTFYFGHDMAVDGYYNIVPTYMLAVYEAEKDDDDDVFMGGFGFTHNIGAAFRWKFLQAGLEYKLGEIELEDYDDNVENYDSKANGLKVFFGFKF